MYLVPLACFTLPVGPDASDSALEAGMEQFEALMRARCDTLNWPWTLQPKIMDVVRRQALFLLTLLDKRYIGQAMATLSIDHEFEVRVVVQRE